MEEKVTKIIERFNNEEYNTNNGKKLFELDLKEVLGIHETLEADYSHLEQYADTLYEDYCNLV